MTTICPYQGLYAFDEQHAPYFFGREADSARLWQTVQARPLVALLGPSGSGKSSVARAGLLPRARAAGWTIVTFRPEADPFRSLAAGLVGQLEPGLSQADRLIETRKLATAFREGALPLADPLTALREESAAGRLLLLADQFEELYTLTPQKPGFSTEQQPGFSGEARPANTGSQKPGFSAGNLRHACLDLLLAALDGPPWGCLLLTMRADFLGRALAYRPLADALQERQLVLGPMTRPELQRAVEQPAALLDVTFEPGLVARILDDVEAAPGSLPLLQFSLAEMWQRQAPRADGEALPLPEGLYGELRAALLACGPFDDGRALRALFADPRLHPWRDQVPEAGDARARAEATIAALHARQDGEDRPALALLLAVLQGRTAPEDNCYSRLGALREQVSGDPGQPAGGLLTHDAYEAIGEVEGALAGHADRVFARLSEEEQEEARRLFVQLVHPGAGTEDTRRLAARSELGGVSWELVSRLAGDRLVVTGRDATEEERVEVTHEALIQRWRRLQRWMEKDREFRAWQERLRAALRQYEATGEDQGALLRGAALAEAEVWLAASAERLGEREHAYIDASVALCERQAAQREAQRQRELVQARALAEEQRKARNRLRQVVGVLAVGLLAAAVLTVLLLSSLAREEERAEELQRALTLSSARQLMSQAQAEFSTDPRAGLVLFVHAFTLAQSIDRADDVLAASRQNLLAWGRVATLGEQVAGTVISPDGSRLLVAHEVDPGELRDATDGRRLATLTGVVDAGEFSADGSRLLVRYAPGSGELRDAADGTILANFAGEVERWEFSPDGNTLLLDYAEAPGELREVADGALQAALAEVARWEFNAESNRLLVVYVRQPAELRDAAAGTALAELGEVAGWQFSPDGSRLLVNYGNGADALLDPAGGATLATLPVGTEARVNPSFSPDGERLLLDYAAENGALVDAADGTLLTTLPGQVEAWEFSPGGSRLLLAQWGWTGGDFWEFRDAAGGALLVALPAGVDGWEFSPDGGRLLVAHHRAPGSLRDTADGSVVIPLGLLDIWRFSPDGRSLLLYYLDAPGDMRSAVDGTRLAPLDAPVQDAEYSPDGSWVLVDYVDAPGELRGADGALLATLTSEVDRWGFSPDEQALFIVYDDGRGELRATAGGELLASLDSGVSNWLFGPGGRRLTVGYEDGHGELWQTTPAHLLAPLDVNVIGTNVITPSETMVVHYRDGSAYLLDLAWLEAMAGRVAELPFAELVELVCEYPLDGGDLWANMEPALRLYLEQGGLTDSQVCPPSAAE